MCYYVLLCVIMVTTKQLLGNYGEFVDWVPQGCSNQLESEPILEGKWVTLLLCLPSFFPLVFEVLRAILNLGYRRMLVIKCWLQ